VISQQRTSRPAQNFPVRWFSMTGTTSTVPEDADAATPNALLSRAPPEM
jgi:hypothetical protein